MTTATHHAHSTSFERFSNLHGQAFPALQAPAKCIDDSRNLAEAHDFLFGR